MQNPLVSVIIPVYNTEAYVEAAVQTIIEQTLQNIEILLVDDGSTDQSPALLAALAARDSRIHVYTQVNSGPSKARNRGIEQASGRYIYFMDSDDLLDKTALELCFNKCETNALDMVLFDADTFGADASNCSWFDYHHAAAYEDRTHTGREIIAAMLDRKKYIASPCLYMIRRAFILENDLLFRPGILHEDELFSMQAFLSAQRIGRIDRAFFKRRLRPDSIMGSRFSERNLAGYMTVFSVLRHTAATLDPEARQLIHAYLRYTLNPVLCNAWKLPTGVRLRTAAKVVVHYPCDLQVTTLATLLMKSPLKKLLKR